MNIKDLISFKEDFGDRFDEKKVFLSIQYDNYEEMEVDLKYIKNLGYAAFVQTTAMGNEITVVEKI